MEMGKYKFEWTYNPNIKFSDKQGNEILRIEKSGSVFYKGELITTNKEIEEGLKEFLIDHGYIQN